jgi:hypothetical protein
MENKSLALPDRLISVLVCLPETGMGYQLVKLVLKSGEVIRNHTVLNGAYLLLKEDEEIKADDIVAIQLETKA